MLLVEKLYITQDNDNVSIKHSSLNIHCKLIEDFENEAATILDNIV